MKEMKRIKKIKEDDYDKSLNWNYYLNRPFSLFECSIWYEWYKEYTEKLACLKKDDSLFVEESKNLVKNYRIKEQMAQFNIAIIKLIIENPLKCKQLLIKGIELNKTSAIFIKEGLKSFSSLKIAVDYLLQVAMHCTTFPLFVLLNIDSINLQNVKNKELNMNLLKLSEELRALSYYPELLKYLIKPLAKKHFKKNFKAKGLQIKKIITKEDIELLTINEVLNYDISKLEQRKKSRTENKLFIYQIINGNESINFVDTTERIIEELDGEKVDKTINEMRGQIAFKGKAIGIARIVTTIDGKIDGKRIIFNKGDILITLNSNPNLMHLINKSSAIVSDMGGVSCHAAIISRELKIPCLMGVKNATKIIRNGDQIEVDAENGVVRIINI